MYSRWCTMHEYIWSKPKGSTMVGYHGRRNWVTPTPPRSRRKPRAVESSSFGNFALLISAFSVHSTSFSPILFKNKKLWAFHSWFDDFCFTLIWLSRLIGRWWLIINLFVLNKEYCVLEKVKIVSIANWLSLLFITIWVVIPPIWRRWFLDFFFMRVCI